jgi:uridine kinase
MRLVTTPRIEFLRGLAAEIGRHYPRGRVIVSVDGPLRSGKTALADDLGDVFRERDRAAFRASLENFHHSRAVQAEFGAETAERYYRHGFDYSALRRVLLEPFRMGGSTGFVTKAYDPVGDVWVQPKWMTGPPDAVLIVDGRFAGRAELTGLWNYRIVIVAGITDPADALYDADAHPRESANALVDLADPAHPRRRFADSC